MNEFKVKNGLIVDGDSTLRGGIYDISGSTGVSGQFLSSTPNGVLWVSGNSATPSSYDYIDFNTGYTATAKTGRVYFDTTEDSLTFFPTTPNMDVALNIGQESLIRVFNNSGSQINNGSVVHISGSSLGLPTIVLSNAAFDDRAEVAGVATHNIPNNTIGYITNFGIVRDVNTSGFNVGDELYLSDTINGGFTNNVIGINFSSRVCSVGWVVTSGVTNGKILVSITNENKVQSLTNKQVNILLGNTISTGVFEFTGLTKTSNTTFRISPVRGWFVDNTTNPVIPYVLQVNYSGSTTGQTTPYLTTNDSTYVLLTSASTITLQPTFPTPQERRLNIFLGKVVHPTRSSILNVNNTVDFDVSPMSALRDLWTPIKGINQGIIVSPNGANLNINTSAGTLWGNGIGWVTNQLNPNSVSIPAQSPATFAYRTQTGGTFTDTTTVDVAFYDVNGVRTAISGTQFSTQRIFQFSTGLVRIQYGQVTYPTLAKALAGLTTETFVEYVNNRDNGILIGLLTVASNASDLSDTNQAIFTLVSKFGEVLTGTAGGFSTTTLQQAYDNSVQPEILTNSTLGAVTFRRGSTSESDNVIEVQNNSGHNNFFVNGFGNTGINLPSTAQTMLHISGSSRFNPLLVNTSGGTTGLIVNNNGNVGIGTTTPTNQLTVRNLATTSANRATILIDADGTVDRSSQLIFSQNALNWQSILGTHTSAGGVNYGLQLNDGGTPTFVTNKGRMLVGSQFALPLSTFHVSGNTTLPTLIVSTTGNPNSLFVANNSNVGIGTGSPLYKLQFSPVLAYSDINVGDGFSIYNPSLTSANLMVGLNGNKANVIQSRDGLSTSYSLSLNPYGGNIGIGTASPVQTLEVIGTSYFSGRMGVGASYPSSSVGLAVTNQITGGVIAYGIAQRGFVQNDVTLYAGGIQSQLNKTGAGTLPAYYNFLVNGGGSIAGSVTSQMGYTVLSSFTEATNNYGFYGDLASATGVWNIYMNGTADNYLAGRLGIGTTTPSQTLDVNGDVRLRGDIFDSTNTSGTTGQVLISTPSGIQWSSSVNDILNTKYDKSGGTVSGNVTILGNLTVNGTATTVNTVNLLVYDPIIGLALSQSGTTNPTLDSGIITDRGVSGNTAFVWIENAKQYELGYTNNSYNDTNVTISQYGNLKLNNIKTNYVTDSSNLTGTTNQVLVSYPEGVKWNNIDYIVTAATNNKVIELGPGVLSAVRINANNIASGDYSGVLSGTGNTASACFSTIAGGQRNTASSCYTGIVSGSGNTVSGCFSVIAGGCGNTIQSASRASFIGGGCENITNCRLATVVSGCRNTAIGQVSFIGGGLLNTTTASGYSSFIGGGLANVVNNIYTTISGGRCNTVTGNHGTVSGGYKNTGTECCSTIAGGAFNLSCGPHSFIGGGYGNISVTGSTVGGGCENRACNIYSTVAGGISNTASGICSSVVGGSTNRATNNFTFVGGGCGNSATDCWSTVAGGEVNAATNRWAFVGGGYINVAGGVFSVVTGGRTNTASGYATFVTGGISNTAENSLTSVGGGRNNTSSGYLSFIATGIRNITTSQGQYSGIISGSGNSITNCFSFIGSGCGNTSSGIESAVVGGEFNLASGGCSFIGGGRQNTASGGGSFVGGGVNNTVSTTNSVIGGGRENTSLGESGFIGGGRCNTTLNTASTISGGYRNTSSGYMSTISGGRLNVASGNCSFIGGGQSNLALTGSTVGGGVNNTASGNCSFVGGGCANTASGNCSFVGSGNQNTSSGNNSFVGGGNNNRASGGCSFVGGGCCGTSSGIYSVVSGGYFNVSSGPFSFVGSGNQNTSLGNNSFVGGGLINVSSGSHSAIGAGILNTASGIYAFIGAGRGNTASGNCSTVSGGYRNRASGVLSGIVSGSGNTASGCFSFIGGGCGNISGNCSTIGGGVENTTLSSITTIGGGRINTASAYATSVFAGIGNVASNNAAIVGGGYFNTASGRYASIFAGQQNISSGWSSFIGNGFQNCVSTASCYSFIGSGTRNISIGDYSVIGGGFCNTSSTGSTIGGGFSNISSNCFSVVGGGCRNTASNIGSSIGGGVQNVASQRCSTVSGGYLNIASGNFSAIPGGRNNTASGYSSLVAGYGNIASGVYSSVSGGYSNRASGWWSSIGGGCRNTSSGYCSFIGGGLCNTSSGIETVVVGGELNRVSGINSFIGGGINNLVTGGTSVIVGGSGNTISNTFSVIVGGCGNISSGIETFIGGGEFNVASGDCSFIGGGRLNTTSFNNTFILGSNITANAVDTTFTQNFNSCGQSTLQGTSTTAGCVLLVRNSTPLSLFTVQNNGQQFINSNFTATANNTSGVLNTQTITQRATQGDTVTSTYINPTLITNQNNQTNKGLSVYPLFTGSTNSWTGTTNIIADFGAINVGTQLSVTDTTTGVIYGVNDVSGLPIIDATSNWDVNIYDFPNVVLSKTGKTLTFGVAYNSASTNTFQSDIILDERIGLSHRMTQVSGSTTGNGSAVLFNLPVNTGQTVYMEAKVSGRANNANMDSIMGDYKYSAKRSLTGSLTPVGSFFSFINKDNLLTNFAIDISGNNLRLVVTGNTDTYIWGSTITTQVF